MFHNLVQKRQNIEIDEDGSVAVSKEISDSVFNPNRPKQDEAMIHENMQYRTAMNAPKLQSNSKTEGNTWKLNDLRNKQDFVGFGQPNNSVPDLGTGKTQSMNGRPKSQYVGRKKGKKGSKRPPIARNTLFRKQELAQSYQDLAQLPNPSKKEQLSYLLEMMNQRNEVKLAPKGPSIIQGDATSGWRQGHPINLELKGETHQEQKKLISDNLDYWNKLDSAPSANAKKRGLSQQISTKNRTLTHVMPFEASRKHSPTPLEALLDAEGAVLAIEGEPESQALAKHEEELAAMTVTFNSEGPEEPEAITEQEQFKQEIRALKGSLQPRPNKKKKKKQVDDGAGHEDIGNAFMTQPMPGARMRDGDHEDRKVKLPARQKKDKALQEKEQKLKKCLTFLGIKDTQMLDHLDPDFAKVLEGKVVAKMRLRREREPNYAAEAARQLLQAPPQGDSQTHYFIEKYSSQRNVRGAERRMVPVSRSLVRLGSEIVAVEQTQFPTHPNEVPKRLKVTKFNNQELQYMCSRKLQQERREWKMIIASKGGKEAPYFEHVAKPDTTNEFFKIVEMKKEMKIRLHILHRRIMEALEEARKEKGLLTRTEQQLVDELVREPFDPEVFVDKQFKHFSLRELCEHQQTVLNVFHQLKTQASLLYLEESSLSRIAAQLPSFKEKMAFITSLRGRWREQRGYCSVFAKARSIKRQKSKEELKAMVRTQARKEGRNQSAGVLGRRPEVSSDLISQKDPEFQSKRLDFSEDTKDYGESRRDRKHHVVERMTKRENKEAVLTMTNNENTELEEKDKSSLNQWGSQNNAKTPTNADKSGKIKHINSDMLILSRDSSAPDRRLRNKGGEMVSSNTLYAKSKADMMTLEKYMDDLQSPETRQKPDLFATGSYSPLQQPKVYTDPVDEPELAEPQKQVQELEKVGSKISTCLLTPRAKREMADALAGQAKERERVGRLIKDFQDLDDEPRLEERERDQLRLGEHAAKRDPPLIEGQKLKSKTFQSKLRPPQVYLQGKHSKIHNDLSPDQMKKLQRKKSAQHHQYSYPGLLNQLPSQPNVSVAVNTGLPTTISGQVQKQKTIKAHISKQIGQISQQNQKDLEGEGTVRIDQRASTLSQANAMSNSYLEKLNSAFVEWQKIQQAEEGDQNVRVLQLNQQANPEPSVAQPNQRPARDTSTPSQSRKKHVFVMQGQNYHQAMVSNLKNRRPEPAHYAGTGTSPTILAGLLQQNSSLQNQYGETAHVSRHQILLGVEHISTESSHINPPNSKDNLQIYGTNLSLESGGSKVIELTNQTPIDAPGFLGSHSAITAELRHEDPIVKNFNIMKVITEEQSISNGGPSVAGFVLEDAGQGSASALPKLVNTRPFAPLLHTVTLRQPKHGTYKVMGKQATEKGQSSWHSSLKASHEQATLRAYGPSSNKDIIVPMNEFAGDQGDTSVDLQEQADEPLRASAARRGSSLVQNEQNEITIHDFLQKASDEDPGLQTLVKGPSRAGAPGEAQTPASIEPKEERFRSANEDYKSLTLTIDPESKESMVVRSQVGAESLELESTQPYASRPSSGFMHRRIPGQKLQHKTRGQASQIVLNNQVQIRDITFTSASNRAGHNPDIGETKKAFQPVFSHHQPYKLAAKRGHGHFSAQQRIKKNYGAAPTGQPNLMTGILGQSMTTKANTFEAANQLSKHFQSRQRPIQRGAPGQKPKTLEDYVYLKTGTGPPQQHSAPKEPSNYLSAGFEQIELGESPVPLLRPTRGGQETLVRGTLTGALSDTADGRDATTKRANLSNYSFQNALNIP